MNRTLIFKSLPCLMENSSPILVNDLCRKWFSNRRYPERTIQKFIQLNQDQFNFLKISPILSGSFNNLKLSYRTENFIGAIPLRSPDNGKIFADFLVHPRYIDKEQTQDVNEYIEIIHLLDERLSPEFLNNYELVTKKHVRPPIYFECEKYLVLFIDVLKENWTQFRSEIMINSFPKNRIDWKKYVRHEWNPQRKFEFPCFQNSLSKIHDEMKELFYVFEIAKFHLSRLSIPKKIRYDSRKRINIVERKFPFYETRFSRKIKISNSDPVVVKQLKQQANIILSYNIQANKPWRVDFLNIFEKYIQYVFLKICSESNWRSLDNYRFNGYSSTKKPVWSLKYLEPDIVIYKENQMIFVDAKYKSHFYNLNSDSDYLKEEHRSDLHQIAGYSAFSSNQNKTGVLCYPSSNFGSRNILYRNRVNNMTLSIFMLGIPISASNFHNVYSQVKSEFFDNINKEYIQ